MNQKNFDPQLVVLRGKTVLLEPLDFLHAKDLLEAGNDDEIWRYMPIPRPQNLREAMHWIEKATMDMEAGHTVAFAIVLQDTGKAIGSTRYLDIQRENRSLEIGWTWIGKSWQRSGVNTECKYLLLKHTFEDLSAVRVQLKTDGRNTQSQRAIERLGAKKEGVLRKSRICWDGFIRDTVYYSIIEEEWPSLNIHNFFF